MSGQSGFVAAAYLTMLVVVIGLIIWVIADGRMQRRRLEVLEAKGLRRRSDGVRP